VLTLNLAACSTLPGPTEQCSLEDCHSTETALDERHNGLENRFVLWLFKLLTFPFTAKG
jgi:hypothetical protein